jgi:hypothetical protein
MGAFACGDDGGGGDDPDAGMGNPDGSVGDASTNIAAAPSSDATPGLDAAPDYDAVPPTDATPPTPLELARMAADGAVDVDVPGVLVTYEKVGVGNDVTGFFIQEAAAGPALFVAVDPATLNPVPAVGDDIDLTITEMGTSGMQRQATMVSNVVVNSSANDVTVLTQDVSAAADLVSSVTDYEAELITVTGTLTGAYEPAGAGHTAATFDTAGVTGAGDDLELRMPSDVATDLGMHSGCAFTISNTPMWRFNSAAQASVWNTAEITSATCNAPVVVNAVATSGTEVLVEFDRAIDDASVVDASTQFTIDNALTASAAVVNGRFITLTTSAQTPGTPYTVTVANSVEDIFGAGIDSMNDSAQFSGFLTPAGVLVNELKADITGGCDLIELLVTSAGTLEGFEVMERTSSILTFGALIVDAGDFVVLHFDTNDANCNPGGSGDETMAVDEQPMATYGANFDTAYDWYMTDTGMTDTDNVITVLDPVGTIVDAVFVSDDTTGTAAAASETQAAVVAAAGEWEMVAGGIPMNGFVDDDFNAHAVQDSDAADTIQRLTAIDNNNRDDWSASNLPATWGAPNCGSGSMQFTLTNSVQMFVVPDCIVAIDVDLYGAEGGDGDGSAVGGLGGRAQARVAVTPGETLEVYVGGAGTTVINSATGGYNGGGGALEAVIQDLGPSGTGGGASDIRRGSTLTDRLIVAGGGGGGGWGDNDGYGGAGGGTVGEDGNTTDMTRLPGGGGTQTAGGAVGWANGTYLNSAGQFGIGAVGYHDGAGCGGGGGGWYGGGSGGFAGGGGGSGYVADGGNTNTSMETGVRSGDGEVTISW